MFGMLYLLIRATPVPNSPLRIKNLKDSSPPRLLGVRRPLLSYFALAFYAQAFVEEATYAGESLRPIVYV